LGEFVANRTAAIALGKALFWDTQAGGDGVQACASCHFKAGADDRSINTMATGFDGAFAATGSGGSAGPNYQLVTGDFPFHKLSNTNNPGSTVLLDSND